MLAAHGVVCTSVVRNGAFYVDFESDKLAAYDFEKSWMGIQITQSPVRLLEYFPKLVSSKDCLFMLCISWCERKDDINGTDKATRKLWLIEIEYTEERCSRFLGKC